MIRGLEEKKTMVGEAILQFMESTLPPTLGAAVAALVALAIHRHLGRRRDAAEIRRRMAIAKVDAPQLAVIEGRQARQPQARPARQVADPAKGRAQVA
ncbi:hypothetical protein [Siccirubricoccus sp. G192]|uniref:hypothetical protein n=1 Tax=Siccirubricoccus sp. G192 TaxID=2849651 RepID=UPI001C2B7C54|nr:hypothetical protein [Siccirubricoccus sp. G192]MBV1799083.1 hypothetical protein [Siccirubricoccus sp. G192]